LRSRELDKRLFPRGISAFRTGCLCCSLPSLQFCGISVGIGIRRAPVSSAGMTFGLRQAVVLNVERSPGNRSDKWGVTIFEGEVRIPAAPPFLAWRPHGPRSAQARIDGSISPISGSGNGRGRACSGWGMDLGQRMGNTRGISKAHGPGIRANLAGQVGCRRTGGFFPLWASPSRRAKERADWTC
jgi:hypothetical protein